MGSPAASWHGWRDGGYVTPPPVVKLVFIYITVYNHVRFKLPNYTKDGGDRLTEVQDFTISKNYFSYLTIDIQYDLIKFRFISVFINFAAKETVQR